MSSMQDARRRGSKGRLLNVGIPIRMNTVCRLFIFVILITTTYLHGKSQGSATGCGSLKINNLHQLVINGNSGEKPQSKIWYQGGYWWAVFPDNNGTKLWQLVDTRWIKALQLSNSIKTSADIRSIGNVTHLLLYQGWDSQLVSLEYDSVSQKYMPWTLRPSAVNIHLDNTGETATIDIDSFGRMWVAYDGETEIKVRWSDAPFTAWSNPIILEAGVSDDDICAISALPDGGTGVLWSNQNSTQFGFRKHVKHAKPDIWMADELPAAGSSLSVKDGMADDHLNIAVASDGTLYAAVKTSYDSEDFPQIALLIRRPSGEWDKLYAIDSEGSRGIVLLNEVENYLIVIYTSYRDRKLVYKVSRTDTIEFGPRFTLMDYKVNNATSTKQNFRNEIVVVASKPGIAHTVRIKCLNESKD